MSISIYYEAHRSEGMTSSEKELVENIIMKYSVDDQIEKLINTGQGLNWESFCVYGFDFPDAKPSEGDVIFEGATKLPDNTEDASWIGIIHWCETLTHIRRVLHDAEWNVQVEDHEIQWDSTLEAYDPNK